MNIRSVALATYLAAAAPLGMIFVAPQAKAVLPTKTRAAEGVYDMNQDLDLVDEKTRKLINKTSRRSRLKQLQADAFGGSK